MGGGWRLPSPGWEAGPCSVQVQEKGQGLGFCLWGLQTTQALGPSETSLYSKVKWGFDSEGFGWAPSCSAGVSISSGREKAKRSFRGLLESSRREAGRCGWACPGGWGTAHGKGD